MANKSTTIKFKKDKNSWEQIYGNEINNRLRKDKNLSDVNDKAESRKNLELVGDNNTTHFHDDRYLPKIDAESAKRESEDDQIKKILNQEITDRKKDSQDINKAIVDSENRVTTNMTNTKNELNTNMNTMQSTLNSKMDSVKEEVKRNDVATKTITTSGGAGMSNGFNSSITYAAGVGKDCSYGNCTSYATKTFTAKDNISSGAYTIEQLLNKLSQASHVHSSGVSQCTVNCNCNCNCHSSNSH